MTQTVLPTIDLETIIQEFPEHQLEILNCSQEAGIQPSLYLIQQAIASTQQEIEEHPEKKDKLTHLAQFAQRHNQPEKAKLFWKQAAEYYAPTNLAWAAYFYYNCGELDNALSYLEASFQEQLEKKYPWWETVRDVAVKMKQIPFAKKVHEKYKQQLLNDKHQDYTKICYSALAVENYNEAIELFRTHNNHETADDLLDYLGKTHENKTQYIKLIEKEMEEGCRDIGRIERLAKRIDRIDLAINANITKGEFVRAAELSSQYEKPSRREHILEQGIEYHLLAVQELFKKKESVVTQTLSTIKSSVIDSKITVAKDTGNFGLLFSAIFEKFDQERSAPSFDNIADHYYVAAELAELKNEGEKSQEFYALAIPYFRKGLKEKPQKLPYTDLRKIAVAAIKSNNQMEYRQALYEFCEKATTEMQTTSSKRYPPEITHNAAILWKLTNHDPHFEQFVTQEPWYEEPEQPLSIYDRIDEELRNLPHEYSILHSSKKYNLGVDYLEKALNIAFKNNDSARAQKFYQAFLASGRTDYLLCLKMNDPHTAQKQYQEEINMFKRLGEVDFFFSIGKKYTALAEYNQAIGDIEKAKMFMEFGLLDTLRKKKYKEESNNTKSYAFQMIERVQNPKIFE